MSSDMSRHVANVVICLRDTVLHGHDIRKCDFATPYKSKKRHSDTIQNRLPPFFSPSYSFPLHPSPWRPPPLPPLPPPPSPSAAAAAPAPLPVSTSTSPPPLRLRPAPVSSGGFSFSSPARRTRSLYSPRSAPTTSCRPLHHARASPTPTRRRVLRFYPVCAFIPQLISTCLQFMSKELAVHAHRPTHAGPDDVHPPPSNTPARR